MSKSMSQKLAAPFAHLLGLGFSASADDDKDDGKKSKRAADPKEKDDDDKETGKKGSRADDGSDDDKKKDDVDAAEKDKEEDDDDDTSGTGKKGKKAKADEDDDADDSDDEMKGSSASAGARRRERARCAAIFACPAAGSRPDVAANLAFNTTMSRKEAIGVLNSVGMGDSAPRRAALHDRMADANVPRVGAGGGAAVPANLSPVAAAIIAAGEKARPGK